jgi:hypothetical protein
MHTPLEPNARPGAAPIPSPDRSFGSQSRPAATSPSAPSAGSAPGAREGPRLNVAERASTAPDAASPIRGTLRSRRRQRHQARARLAAVDPEK